MFSDKMFSSFQPFSTIVVQRIEEQTNEMCGLNRVPDREAGFHFCRPPPRRVRGSAEIDETVREYA
jgi:hypothetical protein